MLDLTHFDGLTAAAARHRTRTWLCIAAMLCCCACTPVPAGGMLNPADSGADAERPLDPTHTDIDAVTSSPGGAGNTMRLPPEPAFVPHESQQLPETQSLVSGGIRSASASYSAVRSIGQSPASGYPVRRSNSYMLLGGIIGVTHAPQ